jgi:hypothetical protein
VDKDMSLRIASVACGLRKCSRLIEALVDEIERLAQLVEEVVDRLGGGAARRVEPAVWGEIAELRRGGRDQAGRAVFHVDGTPIALIEVDAAVLQILADAGGIPGVDGASYLPVPRLCEAVAERRGQPQQSRGALAASVCRIKGALRAVRPDANALIVYSRLARGYRLSLARRSESAPKATAAPAGVTGRAQNEPAQASGTSAEAAAQRPPGPCNASVPPREVRPAHDAA